MKMDKFKEWIMHTNIGFMGKRKVSDIGQNIRIIKDKGQHYKKIYRKI